MKNSTKSPQKSDEKTKSGYSIIKGSSETEEDNCYLLQFDGLSEPNPGESTGGAVVFSPNDRKPLFERGEYMGFGTNNQAEYTGLLIGIQSAIDMGIKEILIEGDSNLVINQVKGSWKVNNDKLKVINIQIRNLIENFTFVGIKHVYREKNVYADRITNDVVKTKKSYSKQL